MKFGVLLCLVLVGCSNSQTEQTNYTRHAKCEMLSYIMANSVTEMSRAERATYAREFERQGGAKMESAAKLHKSSAEIQADQMSLAQEFKKRTDSKQWGDVEAKKMISEAGACKNESV
jgi:hypothetical protein